MIQKEKTENNITRQNISKYIATAIPKASAGTSFRALNFSSVLYPQPKLYQFAIIASVYCHPPRKIFNTFSWKSYNILQNTREKG